MAEITKRGRFWYYDSKLCYDVEDAYLRLRKEHNNAQGRNTHGYLQRLSPRGERVHDQGIVFVDGYDFGEFPDEKTDCYQLGLVSGSYTKLIHSPDYIGEDDVYEWADWVFRKGGKQLRVVGRKQKTGRTRTGRKNMKRK